MFIVRYPSKFSRLEYNLLVLELSFIRSHLLWGEFSTFSAANTIHNFPFFSFHQVPITAGWAEAVWNEQFAQHFYTIPAVVNRTAHVLILSPTPYPLGHMLPIYNINPSINSESPKISLFYKLEKNDVQMINSNK